MPFSPEDIATMQSNQASQLENQQYPNIPQSPALYGMPAASSNAASQMMAYNNNASVPMPSMGGNDAQRADSYRAYDAMVAQQRQQQTQSMYPLPQLGQEPQLRPLDQAEAQRRGMTPSAYLLDRRLGTDKLTQLPNGENRSWVNPQLGAAKPPEDILNHPQFQTVLQQDPQKAARVFQALTGQDLKTSIGTQVAAQAERTHAFTAQLQKGFEEGFYQRNPDTNQFESRKWVPNMDPTKGGLVRDSKFTPLSDSEHEMFAHISKAYPGVAMLQNLKTHQPQQQAPIAYQSPSPESVAGQVATLQNAKQNNFETQPQGSAFGIFGNTASGALQSFGSVLSGQGTQVGQSNFNAPAGQSPTHAAMQLRSNPKWQQLFRADPVKATRILTAIQAGAGQGGGLSDGQSQAPWWSNLQAGELQ